jgi:hypothetical protein
MVAAARKRGPEEVRVVINKGEGLMGGVECEVIEVECEVTEEECEVTEVECEVT